MVGDLAASRRTTDDQPLKIGRRFAAIGEGGVALEAEAAVIARIAEHDASGRLKHAEPADARLDQRLADALALSVRPDGDRPEAVPGAARGGAWYGSNRDRGESDMPEDVARFRRHQRDRQGTFCPQTIDD